MFFLNFIDNKVYQHWFLALQEVYLCTHGQFLY